MMEEHKTMELSDVYIEDGKFSVDETETMRLHGNYQIKTIRNEAIQPEKFVYHENMRCQAVFGVGKVLIRKSTENILGLIAIFMRYTHDPCKDLELNMINENKQMRFGTICPTKKTLFTYKSKVFVAYGRYIFGYDKLYAVFQRLSDGVMKPDNTEAKYNSVSSSDEDNSGILDDITNDRIILKNPDYENLADDYIFAFCIFDQDTEILDAFGLYR